MIASPPRGYERVERQNGIIVARADVVEPLLDAYRAAPEDNPTLHGWASRKLGARVFNGRDIVYAISFPALGKSLVIRHNRHGGALRAVTGDLFAGSTRAPRELETSLELQALKIPTPPVVAYAVYPAGFGLARSDVVTEEIPDSEDFGRLLLRTSPGTDDRRRGWNATMRLLKRLASVGIRHHDLNVKNILIRRLDEDSAAAYVLDVDRVEFDCTRRDAYAGNRARLRRSVEKWRRLRDADVSDEELALLRGTATSSP